MAKYHHLVNFCYETVKAWRVGQTCTIKLRLRIHVWRWVAAFTFFISIDFGYYCAVLYQVDCKLGCLSRSKKRDYRSSRTPSYHLEAWPKNNAKFLLFIYGFRLFCKSPSRGNMGQWYEFQLRPHLSFECVLNSTTAMKSKARPAGEDRHSTCCLDTIEPGTEPYISNVKSGCYRVINLKR